MIDIFTIHLPREFASTKVYHMELCAIRDMGFIATRDESGEKHVVWISSGNPTQLQTDAFRMDIGLVFYCS
jgi:hypothetical protein